MRSTTSSFFSDLQKKASDSDLPEVPSLIPPEKRTSELVQDLSALGIACLNEIARGTESSADRNSLLPFISDMVGLPLEADLLEVEKVLAKYSAVDEDFFSASSDQKNAVGASSAQPASAPPPSSSFTTASGMSVGGDKKKNDQGVDKECNVESYIIERIKMEIIETDLDVEWDDIVGLEDVKQIINEIVLWPISRPDIFTGLRRPPKGLLLFGPPGTGKTMIGKCIASRCKATFFSISASSLTSKWVGEGEKMVRALFFLARKMAPSVVFIDEIDSLLSQRTENENEGSRRIKTEFLVQFDGTGVAECDTKHILIIGATNRPQEIDEAARRRLVKRVYVPLPDRASRTAMVRKLISCYKNEIGDEELGAISDMTEGYSGSDIYNLCREATLEPLREIEDIKRFRSEDMRPITLADFESASAQIRKSVSGKDLAGYANWNESFGSFLRRKDERR